MSKKSLIQRAKKRYKCGIKPITGRSRLMDCFTYELGYRMFWFNDKRIGSTHIEKEPLT